jgi:hypothetical protein
VDDLAMWLTQIWDEDEQTRLDELRAMSLVRIIAHPNQQTGQRLAMCDFCDGGWLAEGSRIEMEGAELQHLREKHDHEVTLARIAADREILAEYVKEQWVIGQGHRTEWTEGGQSARRTVLKYLALPHADRPGYREEWRP